MHPDPEEDRWTIKTILKHIDKPRKKHQNKVYCKIEYKDGHMAYHTLDSICMQDPFLAALYGIKKGLHEKPEWRWIKHYIQSSPVQDALTSVFHSYKNDNSTSG